MRTVHIWTSQEGLPYAGSHASLHAIHPTTARRTPPDIWELLSEFDANGGAP